MVGGVEECGGRVECECGRGCFGEGVRCVGGGRVSGRWGR